MAIEGEELYNTICSLNNKKAVKMELSRDANSEALQFIDKCNKSWFSSSPKPYQGQFDNESGGTLSYAKSLITNAVRLINSPGYSLYDNEQERRWKTPSRGFGGGKLKTRRKSKRIRTKRRR